MGHNIHACASQTAFEEPENIHRGMPLIGSGYLDFAPAACLEVDVSIAKLPGLVHQRNYGPLFHPTNRFGVDRSDVAAIGDDVGLADNLASLSSDNFDARRDANRFRETMRVVADLLERAIFRCARDGENLIGARHRREYRGDYVGAGGRFSEHNGA